MVVGQVVGWSFVRFGLVKRKLYRKWFDWREERGIKTMDVNDDGDDKIQHWTGTYLWRATDALRLILCRLWLIVGYTYFVHVCLRELTVLDRAHLGMHENARDMHLCYVSAMASWIDTSTAHTRDDMRHNESVAFINIGQTISLIEIAIGERRRNWQMMMTRRMEYSQTQLNTD